MIFLTGISDLNALVKSMSPKLIDGDFVFCSVSEKRLSELKITPLLLFKEEEGISIIVKKHTADINSLAYSRIWTLITLTVHSDLSAVGFLALVTDKLAKSGISVNIISAYYHDHLFVPKEQSGQAMSLLNDLTTTS